MLRPERVAEVERLGRHANASQRGIARATGVSRGAVARILAGLRPDYEAIGRLKAERDGPRTGPMGRCGGCGRRVVMPCLACSLRREARRRRFGDLDEGGEQLQLELKPAHEARYQQIRRKGADLGDD